MKSSFVSEEELVGNDRYRCVRLFVFGTILSSFSNLHTVFPSLHVQCNTITAIVVLKSMIRDFPLFEIHKVKRHHEKRITKKGLEMAKMQIEMVP
ncbi:two-component system sensor protein histidine kinase [Sesbania bispinosa]|nr:two-component system sensor protein histidine kinase [Sesbania bispinosa]